MSELDIYRNAVKENIEYDILLEKEPLHKDMIDEIVELMAETLNSKREEITIASDTHSMTDVRKRFADINSEHIEY
ncbi:MAG: helix-turn-helix domain-containing protein, partial [Clostridia bacterium]|nr:helix-turn-helix domain-containing protein [Clostridia bacterium]